MNKPELINTIRSMSHISKADRGRLVNSIAQLPGKVTLKRVHVGDVFMSSIFNHPMLVIKKITPEVFLTVMLTSTLAECCIGELPIKYENKKDKQYFTMTISTAIKQQVISNHIFTLPYSQVRFVRKNLKKYYLNLFNI